MPVPKTIKDDVDYRVKLARPTPWKGQVLRPDQKVIVKGRVLTQIKDAVSDAVEH